MNGLQGARPTGQSLAPTRCAMTRGRGSASLAVTDATCSRGSRCSLAVATTLAESSNSNVKRKNMLVTHFLPSESVKLRPKIGRPTVASPTVPVPSTDARELPSVRPTSSVTFCTSARSSIPLWVATDTPRSNVGCPWPASAN